MSAEGFQLIDDSMVDDSIIRREYIKNISSTRSRSQY